MEMKGIIFNIQKFSIHDGPGVRTTVFLKGCPLRCKWCSNPESQLSRVQIMYHSDNCLHCQKCLHTCPEKAVTASPEGRIQEGRLLQYQYAENRSRAESCSDARFCEGGVSGGKALSD